MKRIMIFSHESDVDGLGCIVLAKLAFGEVDYELLPNVEKLDNAFRKKLESGKLEDYDQIFITDFCPYNSTLAMVDANPDLRKKMQILDHHKFSIDDGCGQYSFSKIVELDENGKKTCGTELFFRYLVENNLLATFPALTTFVEYTRLEDAWEWKKAGEEGLEAHDLAILLNVIGKDAYVAAMIAKLGRKTEAPFAYTEEEKTFIAQKKQEYHDTLANLLAEAEYYVDENGNDYGIAYAPYEYRNELSEFVRDVKAIKYFIVVALDKGENGQKSYRAVEEGFDVNEVAVAHGGGGHPAASSVNMTAEQKEYALSLPKKEGLKYLAECSFNPVTRSLCAPKKKY